MLKNDVVVFCNVTSALSLTWNASPMSSAASSDKASSVARSLSSMLRIWRKLSWLQSVLSALFESVATWSNQVKNRKGSEKSFNTNLWKGIFWSIFFAKGSVLVIRGSIAIPKKNIHTRTRRHTHLDNIFYYFLQFTFLSLFLSFFFPFSLLSLKNLCIAWDPLVVSIL